MPQIYPIQFNIKVFNTVNEMEQDWQQLLKLAESASFNSYAPYSDFNVGAAVLMENGEMINGNNQENASYPAGLCAERVAIFHARSNHPKKKILKIAVVAQPGKQGNFVPVSPCGGCRQVISEVRDDQDLPIQILLTGKENKLYLVEDINMLLPLKFSKSQLL